jgi:hypothetical protein
MQRRIKVCSHYRRHTDEQLPSQRIQKVRESLPSFSVQKLKHGRHSFFASGIAAMHSKARDRWISSSTPLCDSSFACILFSDWLIGCKP